MFNKNDFINWANNASNSNPEMVDYRSSASNPMRQVKPEEVQDTNEWVGPALRVVGAIAKPVGRAIVAGAKTETGKHVAKKAGKHVAKKAIATGIEKIKNRNQPQSNASIPEEVQDTNEWLVPALRAVGAVAKPIGRAIVAGAKTETGKHVAKKAGKHVAKKGIEKGIEKIKNRNQVPPNTPEDVQTEGVKTALVVGAAAGGTVGLTKKALKRNEVTKRRRSHDSASLYRGGAETPFSWKKNREANRNREQNSN